MLRRISPRLVSASAARALSTTAATRDYNRITLLGRVASAPTTHVFANEDTSNASPDEAADRVAGVVNFTLATNRRYRNRQNELVELTDWHRVKRIGLGVVDSLAPRLERGTLVLVDGKLRYEKFVDKEGVERNVATVVADAVKVVKRPEGGGQQAEQAEE